MSYPPPQDPYQPDEPVTGDPWTPPSGNPRYDTGHASPPTASFPPVTGYYEEQGAPPAPPRPYKRSNLPIIASLLAVTLLLCAGGVTAVVLFVNRATDKAKETVGALPTSTPEVEVPALPSELPTLPSDLPAIPGITREFTVEYQVTGDGPVRLVYVEKQGGSLKQLQDVDLPWSTTITIDTVGVVSVAAVRTDLSDGSLSCVTKVDGEEVAAKTSTGPFASVSCSKVVY